MSSGPESYVAFLVGELGRLLEVVGLGIHVAEDLGSAVGALQESVLLHLVQVAPDGQLGDAELLGEP